MTPRKALPPDLPLVLVEWVDSARGQDWHHPRDGDYTAHSIFSVGWLYKQTPDMLVVVPHASQGTDGEIDQVVGNMNIPRVAVRRVRTLYRKRIR